MKNLSRLTALLLAVLLLFQTAALANTGVSRSDLDRDTWDEWVQEATEAAEQQSNTNVTITEGGEVYDLPTSAPVDTPIYESTETAALNLNAAGAEREVSVVLPQYGKVQLTVGESGGQWQVQVGEQWINVAGENGSVFDVTFAKVQSLFQLNGYAKVRYVAADGAFVSDIAVIGLSYGSQTLEEEEETPVEEPMMFAARRSANDGIALAAEDGTDGEETPAKYQIIINYVLDGQVVADPYNAEITAGSGLAATVTNPEIVGYNPTKQDSADWSKGLEFAADKVTINVTNIQSDIEVTVAYEPGIVNYTVIHYLQNVDNDQYTPDKTETLTGTTGTTVPEVAQTYEGFYALLYERPAIAANGSTVIEVYYDRYYYLMNFDLEGGWGIEPIYARFGAPISVNTDALERPGYEFGQDWYLVKRDDKETSEFVDELPATMPAENRTYKAVWTEDNTAKVTVVFWGENADDEEYSYIKSSKVYVKPGTEFTFDETDNLVCGITELHTHDENCGAKCGKEEHSHSIANGCYKLNCNETSHNHENDGCTLSCSHASHTLDCYRANGSYGNITYSLREATPGQTIQTNGDGIYSYTTRNNLNLTETHHYLYLNGKWYCVYYEWKNEWTKNDTTSISFDCDHNHSDSCYSCGKTETTHIHSLENGCYELACDTEIHSHSDACGYSCGKTAHTHTSDCYLDGAGLDTTLWYFVSSETVTVAPDGSTVINVYYDRTTFTLTFRANSRTVATITDKWGADISDEFEKAPFNTTYNGRAWKCTESSKYGYALQTLDRMPKFNATFNLYNQSSQTLKTIYYYLENVGANVSHTSWPQNANNFTLLKEVDTYFNYATYEEEYHEIEGFTRYSKTVSGFSGGFSGNEKDFSNNKLYLYYLRNSYQLTFNNGYEDVRSETVEYEAPLSTYSGYTPEMPTELYEDGSHAFGGWYLNPECSDDALFNLDEETMPLGNIILYAKWTPVNRTVEFYLDKDALDAKQKIGSTHPDLTVQHGSKVQNVPAKPTNGDYTFVGWFYMDNGVEKAFDFANMPVRKDMQVYAKWSSNVLKSYFVYFKYKDKDGKVIEIADPITGQALAGNTKTFDAKGGSELYTGYQEGYFPQFKSQSLTIDIENDANNVLTFWYVQKDAVPYTVYYVTETQNEAGNLTPITLDGKTYYVLVDAVTYNENRKAVVTETFKKVSGYMPDAYQKRLVVDGSDDAENKIVFYYTVDTQHAYYKITHMIQNTSGTGYTEYDSSELVGDINNRYTASPMTIAGFKYMRIEYVVNGEVVPGSEIESNGVKLTADGLEIILYYDRLSYPYEVRYLKQYTNEVLADTVKGTALYGATVTGTFKEIRNYKLVDEETSKQLTIKVEEVAANEQLTKNVITFYYTENEVTINYVAVGPEGETDFGSVAPTSETVKVLTGTVQGSKATASSNTYKFVGWYKDAACTQPVDVTWVADNKITPKKVDDDKNAETDVVYQAATYYAKFEYNLTTLTIKKSGLNQAVYAFGDSESAIFTVVEAGTSKTWTIALNAGNEFEVTLDGLTIGTEYTITELTDWTWRYTAGTNPIKHTLVATVNDNIVEFSNTRTNPYWLGGDNYKVNVFGEAGPGEPEQP